MRSELVPTDPLPGLDPLPAGGVPTWRSELWVPTLLLVVGLCLVVGVLTAQTPPAPPTSPVPPTVGKVDPSKEEAKRERIVLESYELSKDYLKATYNFFFGNQGDEQLTLNDWDLCLTGWKAPYQFDVRMVVDDRSGILDLGPIDYLKYRPKAKDLPVIPYSGDDDATATAVIHPGHVYLIYTKDTDAEYWSKLKVLSIEETGRCEIIGELLHAKKKPTPGTKRRR